MDDYLQVWRAPGRKTHIVLDMYSGPSAACRFWWPHDSWKRVDLKTPVTCKSCLRSRHGGALIAAQRREG